MVGATCSVLVYLLVLFYLAHGSLYNTQRAGEIHLQTKTLVDGDPSSSYRNNFTLYAGPIGSEVPDYSVTESTHARSLVFNVAFGISDRFDSASIVEDNTYGTL